MNIYPNLYNVYNKPRRFDGDIIITDPCYIMRNDNDSQLIHKLNFPQVSYPEMKYYFSVLKEDGTVADAKDYPDYIPEEKKKEDMTDDEKFERLMSLIDSICNKMDKAFGTPSENEEVEETKKFYGYSPTRDKEYKAYTKALDDYYEIPHDDWDFAQQGEAMGNLGFKKSIVARTMDGDWSCITVQLDDNINRHPLGKLGNFCADAGLVGVFLLEDILKYNPKYRDHLDKPHCATWIKDFHGEVRICLTEKKYEDEETGCTGTCEMVSVIGTGNICFETVATGY